MSESFYSQGKHNRYRRKLAESGLCPRCGKVSFPYYLCIEHRIYLNMHRAIRRMLKDGVVRQDSEKRYGLTGNPLTYREYKIRDNDSRKLPRYNYVNMTPKMFEGIVKELLVELDRPVSQKELKSYLKDYFATKVNHQATTRQQSR